MTSKTPIHPITLNVIRQMRAFRKARGLSVQKVADEMTKRGLPIQRSVLANFEGGRRPNVSIAELAVLAEVLDVTINDLIDRRALCNSCRGVPPSGFTCNACGASSPKREVPSEA